MRDRCGTEADGRVGMDLDKRLAFLTAQPRDVAVLLVDERRSLKAVSTSG
jgi:hypothetical protein